ncbi:MAG: DNA-3-methyladenine glycosylase 2 family protein [Gammaproteobacteria bacterium]|nr:DNA-3-methyladenine glycosylase 2 family protein [Gammaproteobacteria bacterium]
MDTQIINTGMNALATVDQDIELAFKTTGPPPPRLRPQGLEAFLSIIISQQLSTQVAKVIMQRVTDLLPEVSAQALIKLEDKQLHEAGLSYRKIEYAKGLADAILSGNFNINELEKMDNDVAINAITSIRGLGRWSAEIYLMFSLQRQDIFPADDLALLVALGRLKNLPAKPTPAQARDLIEHWSPWRSVGSLFLWHYYRGIPA